MASAFSLVARKIFGSKNEREIKRLRPDVDEINRLEPEISALSDDDWVAVNTIIEERTVRDLIPALKAARAEGIVEYPLNKIVL